MDTYNVAIPVGSSDIQTALQQAIGFTGLHLTSSRVQMGRKL